MSRSVRELHLMRYGATTSQLKRGVTQPVDGPSREEVEAMVDRLYQSNSKRSEETDALGHQQQVYRSRQQRDSRATSNIPTLFPSFTERAGAPSPTPARAPREDSSHADDNYGLVISRPIASATEVPAYPVDWRLNPSPAHTEGEKLQWLYLCFGLPLLPSLEAVTSETIKAIDRLFAHQSIPMVKNETRRKDVRNMLRDPRRFGLLLDMISTRRTVMAGTPHAAATAIYRHCEEKYPIYVKFVFIGITDNGTKRVARDIFSGGRVPTIDEDGTSVRRQRGTDGGAGGRPKAAAHSSQVQNSGAAGKNKITVSYVPGGGRPLPFTAIDSVHCFVAHPKGDEADVLRAKGEMERQTRDEERRARRYTPKYVPPPPPAWMQHLIDAQQRVPTRREQAYHHYNRLSMLTAKEQAGASSLDEVSAVGGVVIEAGDGQWLFGKALGEDTASPPDEFADDSVQPRIRREEDGVSPMGAYLPPVLETPVKSLARPDQPNHETTNLQQLARSMASTPATREQHYLLMAQRISDRLRRANRHRVSEPGNVI